MTEILARRTIPCARATQALMNFQCDPCGQKYQVADEKLRGRPVTRFRCKKCGYMLLLRAPEGPPCTTDTPTSAVGNSASRPPTNVPTVAAASPSQRTPRARAATMTGATYGAIVASNSETATEARRVAPVLPQDVGWYAGIHDIPVGPFSRSNLALCARRGEIFPETLVWREGMADWTALGNVAVLRGIIPPARLVAPVAPQGFESVADRAASQPLGEALLSGLVTRAADLARAAGQHPTPPVADVTETPAVAHGETPSPDPPSAVTATVTLQTPVAVARRPLLLLVSDEEIPSVDLSMGTLAAPPRVESPAPSPLARSHAAVGLWLATSVAVATVAGVLAWSRFGRLPMVHRHAATVIARRIPSDARAR